MRSVAELTKCVRPNCNNYEVGLDNVRPCESCESMGVKPAPAPLGPPPTRRKRRGWLDAVRNVTPEDIERVAEKGERYARASERMLRLFRRVVR